MKKVISILLVVAMLCCFMVTPVSADETATASVYGAAVTVNTGDTVTMIINIGSNPGYRSYKIVLGYDASALEAVSVSGNVTSNTNTAGKVIATFASATKVEGNGQLFSVSFKVKGTCGTYPVSVSVSELYTDGTVALGYTTAAGSVTVNHAWVKGNTVAPTCTTDGYTVYTCSNCGATENRDIVAAGHKPAAAVKENVVASTCVKAGGYDSVVYCSVCGEELSREWVDSALADHKYGNAVSKNDDVHTYTCSVCDHTYDEAHDKDEDDYHYWCTKCDWKKDKPTNPSSPDPDEPVLGDVESQFNFGLIALIAVVACGAAYIGKRKFVK